MNSTCIHQQRQLGYYRLRHAGGLDAYMDSLDWGCTSNGSGCDTIYIKGLADGRKDGVPNGYMDVILTVEATLSASADGDTMCIDSNWYPDWTYWLWADADGNPLLANWDGPYNFSAKNWHHTVEGYKYNDLSINSMWDAPGEPPIDNWTIEIYDAKVGGNVLATTTTSNGGHYCFNLPQSPSCPEAPSPYAYPAGVWIGEVLPVGFPWMQTEPNPRLNNGRYHFIPLMGANGPYNFGNYWEGDTLGSISGCKFVDFNCNGQWDGGEPSLAGWPIDLYTIPGFVLVGQTTTDATGCYRFDNLPAADYRVLEVNQSGWIQTHPTTVFHSITLQMGETRIDVDFGNCDSCCNGVIIVDTCFAGTRDDFVGAEPSSPSPDLLSQMGGCYSGPLAWFDSAATNQCFGHTFDCWDANCCVIGATVCMRLRASGSIPSTDRLMIGDYSEDGTVYAIMMNDLNDYAQGDPSWDAGDVMTVCLDLANLPAAGSWPINNILAVLQDGDLDIFISDDTEVDWLELVIELCCPCGDVSEVIHTGWDETGQVLINPGDPDDDWRVIETPDGPVNQWATVTTDTPLMPDAGWIGGPSCVGHGYYWFEYNFCLNPFFMSDFFLQVDSLMGNDSTWFYFNDYELGPFVGNEMAGPFGISHSFVPGCNSIRVKVSTDAVGSDAAFTLHGYIDADSGQCCCFAAGDVNGDGMALTVADLSYLIAFVSFLGPPPDTLYQADLNCDCVIDQLDVIKFQEYYIYGMSVFPKYPVPTCCCPDTVRGACCDTLDSCLVLSPDNCEDPPDDYQGDGISCTPNPCGQACCVSPIRGNVDGDTLDVVDISDLVYLVDYMFTGGPPPSCVEEANVDASGIPGAETLSDVDIADLVYLVDYMFAGGPAPKPCP